MVEVVLPKMNIHVDHNTREPPSNEKEAVVQHCHTEMDDDADDTAEAVLANFHIDFDLLHPVLVHKMKMAAADDANVDGIYWTYCCWWACCWYCLRPRFQDLHFDATTWQPRLLLQLPQMDWLVMQEDATMTAIDAVVTAMALMDVVVAVIHPTVAQKAVCS